MVVAETRMVMVLAIVAGVVWGLAIIGVIYAIWRNTHDMD